MSDITKLLSAETRHEIRSSHQFIILMPPILVFAPIQGKNPRMSQGEEGTEGLEKVLHKGQVNTGLGRSEERDRQTVTPLH